jgi:hypothetical protein
METNRKMREYLPGGAHTSSSIGAWVNYFGSAPDPQVALRECEAAVGEPCVIVDGNDDWGADPSVRPEGFVSRELISQDKLVAIYHSGSSGISRSGFVIRVKDLDGLRRAHEAKWPETWKNLRLHLNNRSA